MTADENWECVDCTVMGCSQYGEIVAPYEKKLAIAVDALEYFSGNGSVVDTHHAQEALKKIAALKELES